MLQESASKPKSSVHAEDSPNTDMKKRFIQQEWPRDPNGEILDPGSSPKGKRTSNGIEPWGETVLDFYWANRIPDVDGCKSIVSGSKMAAWMRELGELDWAKDEFHWADCIEGIPIEVPPCDIGVLVEDFEKIISFMGKYEVLDSTPSVNESTPSSKSLFDPGNYVYPWPLMPFSILPKPVCLQKRIPLHLLPQKLVVHDPWNLLAVEGIEHQGDAKWNSVPDRVHTYQIQLSESLINDSQSKEQVREEELRVKSPTEPKIRVLVADIDVSTSSTLPTEPIILVLPPRPRPLQSIPEAHLYLSPAHCVGRGHHSFVYNAEWELPRSLLVEEELCEECIDENLDDILANESGEKLTGTLSFVKGYHKDESEATSTKTTTDSSGNAGEPSSSKNTLDGQSTLDVGGVGHLVATKRTGQIVHGGEGVSHDITVYECTYNGPYIKVHSQVTWQNPERGQRCKHISKKAVQPTAKVRVAAKLSIKYDKHLAAEAQKYMSFPSHLFEHWNGFNIVRPLVNPVPVGAVVPQFYGYYVPEDNGDSSKKDSMHFSNDSSAQYLSPILLLENCGVPVDPAKLGIDDREECASLYFRLHRAGWNHGSVALRNILVQPGPLTMWPFFRDNSMKSFRLIDFGRSYARKDYVVSREESEMEITRLFRVHFHQSG